MNTNETSATANRPLWQQISGIDPQTESEMSSTERNAAIRKLVAEVTARSIAEFASEDKGEIPAGERTIFWDPLQRICLQLGISRTKLSAYSRELTGMRAHEISDRILAKRKLKVRLQARIEYYLRSEVEFLHSELKKGEISFEQLGGEARDMARLMKSRRKFERSASFAVEMGFANYSRLNRACLLAFGKSLDQIEAQMVCTYVQKVFEELKGTENLTQSRKVAKEQPKNEPVITDEEKIAGDRIIKEAVEEALGLRKPKMQVA